MVNFYKRLIKQILGSLIVKTKSSRAIGFMYERVFLERWNSFEKIGYKGTQVAFANPNQITQYRISTFATKEPETLEWIDGFDKGEVFWDIGANIGLYSCYAALSRNCKVIAIEPSPFNLELLARNINLNNLANSVTVIPLALTSELKRDTLRMSTLIHGEAMSTFGENYDHLGLPMNAIFQYPTHGISMDDLLVKFGIQAPAYIKIDVDGIEHLILMGGASVLRATKSVLVEVNDDFAFQAERVAYLLTEAGFQLKAKRHAENFDFAENFTATSFNQIWGK